MACRIGGLVLVLALAAGRALGGTETDPGDAIPNPVDTVSAEDLPVLLDFRDLRVRTDLDTMKLISLRGMEIPPCVVVEGRPLCIDETAAPGGSVPDIPSDLIDRIEVLRGPQGTLFGRDALGGVVQLRVAGDEQTWCAYGNGAAVPIRPGGGASGASHDGYDDEDEDKPSPLAIALRDYARKLAAEESGAKVELPPEQYADLFRSTQVGYSLGPMFGVKGKDGIFTFPGIGGGPSPDGKIVLDLFPDTPLDAIVTAPPLDPNLGGPIRRASLDAKTFFFAPGKDVRGLFGRNARSSTNTCRDKQLVPPIDWSKQGAAVPTSSQSGAIPSSAVKLPR